MPELKKININQPINQSPTSPSSPSVTSSPLPPKSSSTKKPASTILTIILAILAGVGTGFALYRILPVSSISKSTSGSIADSDTIKVGDVFGVKEEDTFSDTATGVLEKGGINGEGSHRLIRDGGPSQTVYLTSSIVDLDEFVGHKIEVWGETFASQHVGWLMDIGKVKIVELNAEKPWTE